MNKRFITVLSIFLVASRLSSSTLPSSFPDDDLKKGLHWLYQLRYDKAIAFYDHHITAYPEDPAGYFYKAAADWWHLAQEFEYKQPDIEARFQNNVDLTMAKAEARVDSLNGHSGEQAHEKGLAYLYWGGASGLRGRWLVTQKRWAKAYFAGRDGDTFLKKALQLDPTLYDAYMGLGIYDYFSDTLSGFMGFMSSIFVRGDRKRGIKELELAIQKSPHARVESQVFLVEIYTFEENTPAKAVKLATTLKAEFPNSPLMHLLLITALYQTKQWDRVSIEAQDYLSKSEKETPWYNRRGIEPALYCLAVADFLGKNDFDQALKKLNRIIENASPHDPSRWIGFAYLRRGQIYDLKQARDQAVADYRHVLERPELWDSHREANRYLKTPFIKKTSN